MSRNPLINLLHFSGLLNGKKERKVATTLWVGVSWILWKCRNAKIFRNEPVEKVKMFEELKARTWSWIRLKEPKYKDMSFEAWSKDPIKAMSS